jgi:hypothetical protein
MLSARRCTETQPTQTRWQTDLKNLNPETVPFEKTFKTTYPTVDTHTLKALAN